MLGRGEFDAATTSIRCLSRIVHPGGKTEDRRFAVRLYTLPQLAAMLDAVGLRVERARGDLSGSPYGMDSQRMVVLGTKAS